MEKTTISKEQFIADVRHEVEMLKKHGFKKELAQLDFSHFDYNSPRNCIYGQMTGSCESPRAKSLMTKACVRVTHVAEGVDGIVGEFDEMKDLINGKYTGQPWKHKERFRTYNFLSMIETYICLHGSKPKNIIDYLKGEVETLELPLD